MVGIWYGVGVLGLVVVVVGGSGQPVIYPGKTKRPVCVLAGIPQEGKKKGGEKTKDKDPFSRLSGVA